MQFSLDQEYTFTEALDAGILWRGTRGGKTVTRCKCGMAPKPAEWGPQSRSEWRTHQRQPAHKTGLASFCATNRQRKLPAGASAALQLAAEPRLERGTAFAGGAQPEPQATPPLLPLSEQPRLEPRSRTPRV